MKILIVKRRAMGDTVLLSSTLEIVRQKFPEAEIFALVPRAFAGVLAGNPHLKGLWHLEEPVWRLLPKIRRERFDLLLQLHLSQRVRWISWLGGAKRVLTQMQDKVTEQAYGFHPNALAWDRLFLEKEFPTAAKVSSSSGPKISASAEGQSPLPKVYLSEWEQHDGKAIWQSLKLEPNNILFLGLGASRSTKRWSPEHFARLAELARDRLGLQPAFAVGPGDEEEQFAAKVMDCLRVKGFRSAPSSNPSADCFGHLAGLSLRNLAKALAQVRAYVGNDSGPKHLAVALGKPTITLFGPEDPLEWHPYDREQHPYFFLPNLSCRTEDGGRWCGVQICNSTTPEKHRCMDGIDPLEVYLQLEKILR
jgi:ADP-heptose:LPS heptosyltransferase